MAKCPVYSVARVEGSVARGKLALIEAGLNGQIKTGKKYRFFLSACLLCGSCVQSCPSEVDTPRLVRLGRQKLAAAGKTRWLKRLFLQRFLPSRRMLPVLFKGARACRALWAAKVPDSSGLHVRFLKGPGGQRHSLPKITKPFFTDRELPREFTQAGLKVAWFSGCVSNYLRPQASESALRVLSKASACVVVPATQGCCGLPALAAGETEAAKKLARRNLEAFLPEGGTWPDVITTACASCAVMLKKHLPELLASDENLAARAKTFGDRVEPFSRLYSRLASGKGDAGKAKQPGLPVLTYHDPCHLSKGFKEKDAPRLLLTKLAGARFVEMRRPCGCCGQGGSFNITHYDLSLKIADKKVKDILASGAEVLVTECSGCILQLSEVLRRAGSSIEVISTPEALELYGDL
ncbi:MAG: (Fe-S)-binding protein [Deltaproteobacteria bacterium]|nr:(Fe-S)-binding protein [Deltaproteobacteria bacterium]